MSERTIDLADTVLAAMQQSVGEDVSVQWDEPAPARATGDRAINHQALFALLRLCPGKWVRVGPCTSGSYHASARKVGLQVTSRVIDGTPFMFFRWPIEGEEVTDGD